jgi:hypothetical protein
LQRGAIELLTPFFCLQEKGDGGMSTCKVEEDFKFLLFIPDSHIKKNAKDAEKLRKERRGNNLKYTLRTLLLLCDLCG